jgi:carboxypeptidase C (cathepsin A)
LLTTSVTQQCATLNFINYIEFIRVQFKRSFTCGFLYIYILFIGNTDAADEAKTKPETLESFLEQARAFTTDELMPAIFKGNTIDAATHNHIPDRLAYFTELTTSYVDKTQLRIQGFRFAKELLRDKGLSIRLLDACYTVDEVDDFKATPDHDPGVTIIPTFNSALMSYIRSDLGVNWNRTYLATADDELSDQWSWRTAPINAAWEPTYVNTAHDLSKALRINPALKVLVASSYYNLVTPFFDAEYTLNHHGIKAE